MYYEVISRGSGLEGPFGDSNVSMTIQSEAICLNSGRNQFKFALKYGTRIGVLYNAARLAWPL